MYRNYSILKTKSMLNFQQNGENMKKYSKILQSCPLFAGIAAADLETMLSCLDAKVISFDKKYTIFAEGNPATYLGVLLNGSAQIQQVDYYGNRVIISDIRPSEVFGEAFATAEVPSLPISIIANEPSEVLLIRCSRILRTCQNACGFHQTLIYNLMKDLATKNIQLHQKAEITAQRTTREKLLAYLMLEAKKTGSNAFSIPFDRQALADYLAVDRSGLSAEISKLQKEGILRSRKHQFELL